MKNINPIDYFELGNLTKGEIFDLDFLRFSHNLSDATVEKLIADANQFTPLQRASIASYEARTYNRNMNYAYLYQNYRLVPKEEANSEIYTDNKVVVAHR